MKEITKTKILSLLCLGGLITTVYTSVKGGIELSDHVDEYIAEKNYGNEKQVKRKYAKTFAKDLTPAAISFIFTGGMILSLRSQSINAQTALMSSLFLAKSQVDKLIKEDTQASIAEPLITDDLDVPPDRILVYEPYSDQLIVTSESALERAEAIANKKLQENYVVRLSTIIKALGGYVGDLQSYIGWEMGNEYQMQIWNVAQCAYISLKLTKPTVLKGREVYILKFEVPPAFLSE